ncbi:MAG TPA: hypothetical protein VGL76_10220 [Gaiellaceae bacterium]
MRALTTALVSAPSALRAPWATRRAAVSSDASRLAPLALGLLVVGSAVARGVAAVLHSTPLLFPDEYIYAALGRALGHGNLEIRGETAHFPAILEPLVAAPIWSFFGTATAYHLVQVENAIFVSLAAVPVYLIARWLELDRRFAFFCAGFALLLPDLTLDSYTSSDALGYLLILTSVLVGLRALEQPTRGRQLAFLGLAILTSLDRLQYIAVVPAYLAAALVLERRRIFRTHRVAIFSAVPVVLIAVIGGVGYYFARGSQGLHLHTLGVGHWMVLQAFLLTIEAGVIVIPGAIAAMLRPSGLRETAFAVFVGALCLLTLALASNWAAASGRFKARYLFELLPLLAIAFGLYLRRRPLKLLVISSCVVIAGALALLPLSRYTAAAYKTDSQFLFGVWFLERHLGSGSASLVVALGATLGCAGAALIALNRFPRSAAMAWTIAVLGIFGAFAIVQDLSGASAVRATLPKDLTWVDHDSQGGATAVSTSSRISWALRDALYWNTAIQHEVLLHGAAPTDSFRAPELEIGRSGVLRNVQGDVLFDSSSATALLADATRVASGDGLTLWRPAATPRFRLLITDRLSNGWLGSAGSVRAWPLARGRAVRVSFEVSVPRNWHSTVLRLGRAVVVIRPGDDRLVSCESSAGALDLAYSSPNPGLDQELRSVIARISRLQVEDVPAGSGRAPVSCTVGR